MSGRRVRKNLKKENTVRDAACVALEYLGFMCIKMQLLRMAGMPDVLVLMPGGRVWFIEFKRPGETLSKIQEYMTKRLVLLGFHCSVHYTVQGVKDEFIEKYGRG